MIIRSISRRTDGSVASKVGRDAIRLNSNYGVNTGIFEAESRVPGAYISRRTGSVTYITYKTMSMKFRRIGNRMCPEISQAIIGNGE
jgi:hypothetical protein